MKNIRLRRLSQLLKLYSYGQTYDVTIDDLESVFCTSRRNVSSIIKMLQDSGWLDWAPGVGRGKSSSLTITVSLYQALYQSIQAELDSGNFDQLPGYLEEYRDQASRALHVLMQETDKQQKESNSLTVTQYPRVNVLEPARTYWSAEMQVISALYDPLLRVDDNGLLTEHLACEYALSDDQKTYYFWLRPNVQCHDGHPLTSSDVITSLGRLFDTDGPFRWLFKQVAASGFDAAENAIFITLESPNPLFIYALTTPNAGITTERQQMLNGRRFHVGTGPLLLSHWDENKLVMQRNPHYFSTGALLNQITLCHQGAELDNHLSLHQDAPLSESHDIQAFSFLAQKRRKECSVSSEDLVQLLSYIDHCRAGYASRKQLKLIDLFGQTPHVTLPAPQLNGELVLGHANWRLKYKRELIDWLAATIEKTGIKVQLFPINDLDATDNYQNRIDLLLCEEILEQPLKFGLYEWLLTTTALRYAYSPEQLEQHRLLVQATMANYRSKQDLLDFVRPLTDNKLLVPLFFGQRVITKTDQVAGLQLKKTGYLDLHRLWLNQGENATG